MDDTSSRKVISPEAWVNLFISGTPYAGYTESLETAMDVIWKYEVETTSSFISARTKKPNFGLSDCTDFKKHFIRFEYKDMEDKVQFLDFDGIPFLIANTMQMHCHRGLQMPKKSVKKIQENGSCKKKKVQQPTKKVNCPAEIVLKEIILFPDFSIPELSIWKRKQSAKKLRALLTESPSTVKIERRIYVYLPQPKDHKGHDCEIAEEYVQRTDARLIAKLKQLVSIGITKTKHVILCLEEFVAENRHVWFNKGVLPSKSNQRFYPRPQRVRCLVNRGLKELQFCAEDKDNLFQKILYNSDVHSNAPASPKNISAGENCNYAEGVMYPVEAVYEATEGTYLPNIVHLTAVESTSAIGPAENKIVNTSTSIHPETANHCREMLDELIAASYVINDNAVMDVLHSKLLEVTSYVDSSIYLEQSTVRKNKKPWKSCERASKKIPEQKKRKTK